MPAAVASGQTPIATISRWQRAKGGWLLTWAFLGPAITLVTFTNFISPQITIDPGINVDPTDPFATRFIVTNRGHYAVYDLQFSCTIRAAGAMHLQSFSNDGLLPVAELDFLGKVTKSCNGRTNDLVGNIELDIGVTYRWPLIGLPATATAHFSGVRGSPGYFLEPNDATFQ